MINDEKEIWINNMENNPEFLQSWDWGEFQKSLGAKIWRLDCGNQIFALLLRKELPLGFNYLYTPRGPVINKLSEENLQNFLKQVKEIAKREKSIFLKIEPTKVNVVLEKILAKNAFIKGDEVQPLETLVIDLVKSENEILKKMEHDTRYAIRTAAKRGVVIKSSSGLSREEKEKILEAFYKTLQETARRNKIIVYSKRYFEKLINLSGDIRLEIFTAELEGKTIAFAVILFYNNRAFYLYAASESGYGRYNAPSLILWEAILAAKKGGMKNFDFWGFSDNRNKHWAGHSAFKKSFGGERLEYPGAWDYVFNRPLYFVYRFFGKTRKLWRKISRFR